MRDSSDSCAGRGTLASSTRPAISSAERAVSGPLPQGDPAAAAGGGQAAGRLVDGSAVQVAGKDTAPAERDPCLAEQPRAAPHVDRVGGGQPSSCSRHIAVVA